MGYNPIFFRSLSPFFTFLAWIFIDTINNFFSVGIDGVYRIAHTIGVRRNGRVLLAQGVHRREALHHALQRTGGVVVPAKVADAVVLFASVKLQPRRRTPTPLHRHACGAVVRAAYNLTFSVNLNTHAPKIVAQIIRIPNQIRYNAVCFIDIIIYYK